ncbi:MAG: hypothetical protein ACPG6V_03725 [Flavobacteriales bacterium]
MPWNNYLLLIVVASTKFALTPLVSLPMDIGRQELFFTMLFGGLLGYFVFFYFSEYLINTFSNVSLTKRKKEKKIFTKRNRMIINIVRKRGLVILALITPILLSIPVGAFIAARYFTNKTKVNLVMVGSILTWSFIYTTFRSFFVQ